MRNLLQNLDGMLKIRPSSENVSKLKALEMFPIATHKGQWTLQSADSGEFWIPDISVLHECFRGHAPLLDLSDDGNGANISNIVSVLSLKSKLLTEAVKYYYDGNTEKGREYPELERDLERKAAYIGGILKGEGQSLEQITVRVNQVRNIKALRMPQVIIGRYVVGKSSAYVGEQVEGGLRIITKEQRLLVLVHENLKQDAMARLLRKEMARHLEVSQHSDLLGDLLAADDPESLLEDLQRAGAYQMHLADVPAGERTDASEEVDSDGDSDSDETALEKSSNVRTDRQQRFPVSPEGTHDGESDVEDAQWRLNYFHYGKSSKELSESTGYNNYIERTSPAPITAITTPSIRSTSNMLRGSLVKRGLGSADNSSVDFLASALAEVSVADDGPGTSISQDPPGFAGSATQIEDASPAARNPRLMTSREEQNSPSPRQNLNGTNRRRLSRSLGQPLTPSAQVWRGSLQHLHQRSWNGGSSPSQPGSSSERRKEIGRKGEHILYTFLQGELGPSFGEKHWTSNGRKHYIPTCLDHYPSLCPPGCRNYYSIDEGGRADFTIGDSDASQAFTQYLRANWGWNRSVDSNTKYHLEVKSTPNRVENDTYWTLSANQIRMARQWSVDLVTASEPLRHVYVLVRVFDVDGEPRLWFVVDPWASTSLDLISEVAQRPAYALESDTLALAVGYAQDWAHHIDLPAPEKARGRCAPGSFPGAVGQNAREDASNEPFELTFAVPPLPSPQSAAVPTTKCSSFEPFVERDPSGYSMAYQSIPFMDSFKHYSFEELRLADHEMESYISNPRGQRLEQAR
ncbi:uncharacterized protein Z519_10695 [Cladophialophora bantiana CBS 173.52]|uniref:Protein NO VEIN C-terminal domain-containing protein n=1 Tax=Cladophialophora bantiana (strain ATCC 10958 / CBS 173.52 / CDC B-1940 / NIH 8579) TaxID=1442370 RepID=A0A0D2HVQ7_CLAB1|nr:uncharacterized protein Z519_10695 [Cladophialophora bantiana CBS 173.52]KIW88649.1 hypothetical protein Z519_10695 [Cladophialophora bantiana CBS 173.52]